MEEVRRRYMLTRQYLASPQAAAAHSWKRRESGHALSMKDDKGEYNISIVTVIGKVSDTGLFVEGLGRWKNTFADTPMEKAKYQMQLERPEGTPFVTDWDIAIGHAAKFQKLIQKTPQVRNLIIDDNPSEPYLRLVKHAFEEKKDDQPGYDTDQWTVPEEYEMKFFETGHKFRFTPVLVTDMNGKRVRSDLITEALQGNIVECHFSVRHYKLKDNHGVFYDLFTGDIEEVCVLDHAPLMKKMTHVNWHDILANAPPSIPPAVRASVPPPVPPTPRANTPARIPKMPIAISPMVDLQMPGVGPNPPQRNVPTTPTPRTRQGKGSRRPPTRVIASSGTSNLMQTDIAQSGSPFLVSTSSLATMTMPNSVFRPVADLPVNSANNVPQTPPSFSGSATSLTQSDIESMLASQDRAARQTPSLFSGSPHDWTSSPTMLIGGVRQPLHPGLHVANFGNGEPCQSRKLDRAAVMPIFFALPHTTINIPDKPDNVSRNMEIRRFREAGRPAEVLITARISCVVSDGVQKYAILERPGDVVQDGRFFDVVALLEDVYRDSQPAKHLVDMRRWTTPSTESGWGKICVHVDPSAEVVDLAGMFANHTVLEFFSNIANPELHPILVERFQRLDTGPRTLRIVMGTSFMWNMYTVGVDTAFNDHWYKPYGGGLLGELMSRVFSLELGEAVLIADCLYDLRLIAMTKHRLVDVMIERISIRKR
ncbi:hypothetical protein C8F01DRAFT_1263520 [Mycena amicta]|nr:hypothetical protein C8F01DRAFT_1263520 [Mycena amicta]